MTTKKIIGKIHLWLGLTSGLVVFILGISGCILVFESELKDLFYKERYLIKDSPVTAQKRLPVHQLMHSAKQALNPEENISGIGIYRQPQRTAAIYVYKYNAEGWNYFNTTVVNKTIYLNPYSGKIQYVENSKSEFFRLMVMLHYDLLLEKTGKQIIGYATLIFIVLLISGLVLWWPRSKAAAKQRFAFRWKDHTKWKRKNYDLHNILGFYTFLFALIVALTGLVWAFSWFDNGLQWLANGGQATPVEKEYQSDSTAVKNALVYDDILADMQRKSSDDLYSISIPEQPGAAVYAYSQTEPEGYRWTSFYYDQQTGKNLSTVRFDDRMAGEQLRSMNYYIHTGAILNLPGKILAFIVSFICAGLPVTGFYIWMGRHKKGKKTS